MHVLSKITVAFLLAASSVVGEQAADATKDASLVDSTKAVSAIPAVPVSEKTTDVQAVAGAENAQDVEDADR
jgi:hypothetical protein